MRNIFRKDALEKISSPDQLDKSLSIAPSYVWIAILVGFLAIAIAVVWSFLGVYPEKVSCYGIVTDKDTVVCYAALSEKSEIKKGQKVIVGEEYEGEITGIGEGIPSLEEIAEKTGSESVASYFLDNGPVFEVEIEFDEETDLSNGSLVNIDVVTKEMHPYEYLLDSLK